MLVNKVENNMNFKMALKVDVAARPKLKSLPIEKVNKINEFGEKIKGITRYNVHLNKDMNYEIRHSLPEDKIDYLAKLRKEEAILGKHYEYTNLCGGCEETVGGWYPDQPQIFRTLYGEKAKQEYDKFKKLSFEDQLAQYSEMLEKVELDNIAKQKEEAIEAAKKAKAVATAEEQKETALNNLLEKYGYEEPAVKIDKNEDKKGFFKKIFHRV